MMLCPHIPFVSAYVYQVGNEEYANLFCHKKIRHSSALFSSPGNRIYLIFSHPGKFILLPAVLQGSVTEITEA